MSLAQKRLLALSGYCREEVVAVIDSVNAGEDIASIIGVGKGIPIVSTPVTEPYR